MRIIPDRKGANRRKDGVEQLLLWARRQGGTGVIVYNEAERMRAAGEETSKEIRAMGRFIYTHIIGLCNSKGEG